MLISKKWLNKYIDVLDIEDEKLDSLLSLSGTSVESIDKPWQEISGVHTGTITQITNHPNADKLIICKVDTKDNQYQIVTGDTSLKEGDIIPLAKIGATLKDGFKIKKAKLRGESSEGMMCSLEELKLEQKSQGVYRFSERVENGLDVVQLFDLDDSIYDLEITANRPDELSFLGVAREIRALLNDHRNIKDQPVSYQTSEKTTSDFMSIKIENSEFCNRYSGLIIEDVKVQPSPLWLKRDLMSIGIRPINNVVDITNYILMETGHPVHAFDYDKLENKSIVVRLAKEKETLQLLNEETPEFTGDELLITDGKNPLALAGIMGGEGTGVTEKTKTVFLEVAYFNPVKIRKIARRLNIMSDSSYRFERGVDPNDAEYVLKRLAHLISQLASGTPAKELLDVYPNPIKSKQVLLRKEKVEKLLGINYTTSQIEDCLIHLDFDIKRSSDGNRWEVNIPTFRPDIEREVDLVEEIGRVVGYDKIPSRIPYLRGYSKSRDSFQTFRYNIRELVMAAGYNEIIPISLIDPDDILKISKDKNFSWNKDKIEIMKSLSKDMSILRPSLLITMLKTMGYNHSHQQYDLKLFETGSSFLLDENGCFQEHERLIMAATGKIDPEDYQSKQRVDFFNFKGSIEEILWHLEIDNEKIVFDRLKNDTIYTQIMYPGQSASVLLNGEQIGVFGLIRQEILDAFAVTDITFFCELDLERIQQLQNVTQRKWRSILGTNFPASRKDFSVLVGKGTEIGHIIKKIKLIEFVENVTIIDVYSGKNIPKGYNSITLSVLFRSTNHTLTETELNRNFNAVIKIFEEERLELREG
ncbi:MAG: phenylalanine--tRNA ligase subunit beta [Thermotogota bacterium]|nr:phenylalanine--tRNA ligase subunit beta [Thermotogota bacterium]